MTPLQLVNNLLEDDPLPVPLSDLFHVPKKGLVLKYERLGTWALYHSTYDIGFGEIKHRRDETWEAELYKITYWINKDYGRFKSFDKALDFLINNKQLVRAVEVLNSLNLPEWLKIKQEYSFGYYDLMFYMIFEEGSYLQYRSSPDTAKAFIESPKLWEIYAVLSAYFKNPDPDIKIQYMITDIYISKRGTDYININTDIFDNSPWDVRYYSPVLHNPSFNTFSEAFNYALEQLKQRST